jgi:Zn-finger nucleic acid-binding protein
MLTCPFCGGPCAATARACPHCDVQLASVRCSSCFALHFTGSRFCARCGKELELEPLLDATNAPCPRCSAPLSVAAGGAPEDFQGVAMMHECVKCGGVFLDERSLERIVALRRHPPGHATTAAHVAAAPGPHALEPVRYVKCPMCLATMNRVNFGKRSGVIVDVCKGHGTWFDAGELTRAIEFVARGGLDETRRRDEDEAKKQKADPAVARAAAELQAELTREAVAEGRAIGWWEGRGFRTWGDRHETLLDVIFDLLS